MATDTAAPSDTSDDSPGRPRPTPDAAALRRVLDGRYAEVRDLVRSNLAEHAAVLDDAETLPMASTGQRGMVFAEEYGG